MKYVSPKYINESEGITGLANAISDEEVVNVALSAIYHCDTHFAGDTLFEAYQKVLGPNRLYLGNITLTFLGMHRTTYRVDDFINEMKKEGPDPLSMSIIIEEAKEYKEMFHEGGSALGPASD